MGLLGKALASYRPRVNGVTVATERFPFGFAPNERQTHNFYRSLRTDQFFPLDEIADPARRGAVASPPVMVPLDDLTATQRGIHEGFLDKANDEPLTLFVNDDGRLLIIDGHHRAARARARGETEVLARIFSGGSE